MQMNEQVLTALEVLRNFAENDFERHRIDVLEKDLIAPPKVEQIDETHQKFEGVIYRQNQSGHYVNSSSIHQAVYRYYCGEIPKGYEIHHKDLNPANNAISNLQPLTPSSHHLIHREIGKSDIRRFICRECGKVFFTERTSRNFFCSKKCCDSWRYHNNMIEKTCKYCGEKFFSYKDNNTIYCSQTCVNKAKLTHKSLHKERIIKCQVCGKEFKTKCNRAKFCSQRCKDFDRYHSGKENEIRTCVICGKEFTVNKYSKGKTCSRNCASILKRQNRKQKN